MAAIRSTLPEQLKETMEFNQIPCCDDGSCPNIFTTLTVQFSDVLSMFPALYNFTRYASFFQLYKPFYSFMLDDGEAHYALTFGFTTETFEDGEKLLKVLMPRLLQYLNLPCPKLSDVNKTFSISFRESTLKESISMEVGEISPMEPHEKLQVLTTFLFKTLQRNPKCFDDVGVVVNAQFYIVITPHEFDKKKFKKLRARLSRDVRLAVPGKADISTFVEGKSLKDIV
jgi:hypothetical protein